MEHWIVLTFLAMLTIAAFARLTLPGQARTLPLHRQNRRRARGTGTPDRWY